MAITVISTTETQENVAAVNADKGVVPPVKAEEKKSASPVEKPEDETASESDELENEAEETEEPEEGETEDEKSDDEKEELDTKAKDEAKKPQSGVKKRIDKLRARETAARQEAEYWKQEALKQRTQGPAEEKAKTETKAAAVEGRPSPDDFATHAEFVEALSDWKFDQKLKAKEAADRDTQLKNEYQSKAEAFRAEVKKFAETHEDFEDVVTEVDDVKMSPTVETLLLKSEFGPELMYELAKNREEYERICRMNALDAARAIGKVEARLEKSKEAKQETKKSKAPAPIAPVTGRSSSTTKSIYDPNLSQREYEQLRERQLARRA